jgi:hypothetical protein
MSNVVQLFPQKVEPEVILPAKVGIFDLVHQVADWAESEGVDVHSAEFIYEVADIMQRIQMLAYKAAA